MLGLTLQHFAISVGTFLLFTFTVPYMTGSGLLEASDSGWYRYVYYCMSGVGRFFYTLIETFTKTLFPSHGALFLTANLACYAKFTSFFCSKYDELLSAVIGGSVEQINWFDSSSYSRLSDLLVIKHIFDNIVSANSIGEFVFSLAHAVFSVAVFVVVTIGFFSMMYGFLEFKLLEFKFIDKWFGEELLDWEPSYKSIKELPKALLLGFLDFANEFSIVRNVKYKGTALATCAYFLVGAFRRAKSGELPDWSVFVLDLLDEANVINVIGSFFISYFVVRTTEAAAHAVVERLPEETQKKIHEKSEALKATVISMRRERVQYAIKEDACFRVTENIEQPMSGMFGDIPDDPKEKGESEWQPKRRTAEWKRSWKEADVNKMHFDRGEESEDETNGGSEK